MARPKLGEGDTERLHVKISKEELKSIDDWRFENRISSRSEAVRRLCQIGIFSHGRMKIISDQSDVLLRNMRSLYEAVEEEIDQTYLTDNPDKSQVLISDAFDAAETLAMEVEVLSKATAPLLGERNFSVAAEKSKDLIYETILSLSEALRRRKSRDDRRTLFLAIQSWSDATHDSFEKMDDEEQDQFLADEIARILAKRTKSEGEGE